VSAPSAWLRDIAADLKVALQFCTRLPLPRPTLATGADVARTAWAIPLAGALIGFIGAIVYALAHVVGLPPLASAALAVAATIAITGALHEDGLADTADGLGGGKTREQKLDIMRDSRIGTYGTCALTLSIVLRTAAIAHLAAPALVLPALIATHAAARATMPIVMWLVPSARNDGLAADAGRVSQPSALSAGAIGVVILIFAFGFRGGLSLMLLLLLATLAIGWLGKTHIGGQTGDLLGALEQVAEIIVLLTSATLL
jgi:adenosylcobinamide-GDP ribazoletransferase